MNNNDTWSNLSGKFGPLASKITKGFTQARQWSEEKLGTASDVTELPADYIELERKVDTIRNLHLQLIKLLKGYTAQLDDTLIPESLQGLTKTIASSFANTQSTSPVVPPAAEESKPKTVYNAFGKAAFEGAGVLGTDDPFGTILMKFGSVEDKIGENKARMNQTIQKQVLTPLNGTLNTTIQLAMKARRNVVNLRLELDGLRSRHRNVKPEKMDQAKKEIDDAEEALVLAVDEASELMRAVIDNPEPLRNLTEIVAAQMDFYKEAYELLADIAPEIDEIQVTHESVYRANMSG